MESKVDKLEFDKLVPVPGDLSKQGDIFKNDVVKKDVYNGKIKDIKASNAKIKDIKDY